MSLTQVELEGTLHEDGTLVLDNKPTLPPGRVKVVVQSMAQTPPTQEGIVAFVRRVRREAEARGHHFMTDEEVTAWVEELRADDDRIEEAYRQSEEHRRKEQKP